MVNARSSARSLTRSTNRSDAHRREPSHTGAFRPLVPAHDPDFGVCAAWDRGPVPFVLHDLAVGSPVDHRYGTRVTRREDVDEAADLVRLYREVPADGQPAVGVTGRPHTVGCRSRRSASPSAAANVSPKNTHRLTGGTRGRESVSMTTTPAPTSLVRPMLPAWERSRTSNRPRSGRGARRRQTGARRRPRVPRPAPRRHRVTPPRDADGLHAVQIGDGLRVRRREE